MSCEGACGKGLASGTGRSPVRAKPRCHGPWARCGRVADRTISALVLIARRATVPIVRSLVGDGSESSPCRREATEIFFANKMLLAGPSMQADTDFLKSFVQGDADAATRVSVLVYDQLRGLAKSALGRYESATLCTTALTHEAYMRLVGDKAPAVDCRRQFYALAAKVMRNVLIDHARNGAAAKRGGGNAKIPLDQALDVVSAQDFDWLELDTALDRLGQHDARMAQLVELRFFGGLTMAEVSQELDVSEATATRDWRMARAWLRRELTDPNDTHLPS